MLKHLENHKILTNFNHRFRAGYSCTTIRGSRRQRIWLGIWHIQEGHLCGIKIVVVPILWLVVRPNLHGHYLSVRLQLLLSLSGFVRMMIATDVYFLQFHSCVVYLRVLCVVLCQRLLRNLCQIPSQILCRRLPLIVDCNHIEDSVVCATTVEGFSSTLQQLD
jgi:hypothetical protein